MKVILKRDVERLGGAGDVVDVADGYANNYLMPRNLAMRATRGSLADAEAMRASRSKRETRTREDAETLREQLERVPIQVFAKAGEDGTLFGSVGNTAVVQAIRDQLNLQIDRRRIPMPRPLKHTGQHEITARLASDVEATLRVQVLPSV